MRAAKITWIWPGCHDCFLQKVPQLRMSSCIQVVVSWTHPHNTWVHFLHALSKQSGWFVVVIFMICFDFDDLMVRILVYSIKLCCEGSCHHLPQCLHQWPPLKYRKLQMIHVDDYQKCLLNLYHWCGLVPPPIIDISITQHHAASNKASINSMDKFGITQCKRSQQTRYDDVILFKNDHLTWYYHECVGVHCNQRHFSIHITNK